MSLMLDDDEDGDGFGDDETDDFNDVPQSSRPGIRSQRSCEPINSTQALIKFTLSKIYCA